MRVIMALTELICKSKGKSLPEEVIFDVADVFNLLNKLGNRYTASLDGIRSILLKRLAAPLAVPLYILFILQQFSQLFALKNGRH